jgi:hypothetical protein
MSALLYEMLADCEPELDRFLESSFLERTFTRVAYWVFETRNNNIASMPEWYKGLHGYSAHSDKFPTRIFDTWGSRLLGIK